jgi:hypothetical protein
VETQVEIVILPLSQVPIQTDKFLTLNTRGRNQSGSLPDRTYLGRGFNDPISDPKYDGGESDNAEDYPPPSTLYFTKINTAIIISVGTDICPTY